MGAIEGYPAGNSVERLTGKVDYGDAITTQLWKKVDNLSALVKQHLQAGGSNQLCGPLNPHGIGTTRFTFSVALYGAMERNLIEQDISNKLAFGMVWARTISSTTATDCSSYTITGSPTLAEQQKIFANWYSNSSTQALGSYGHDYEGADLSAQTNWRVHQLGFYTGFGMADRIGDTVTNTSHHQGVPDNSMNCFIVGEGGAGVDLKPVAIWKDPSSGYLKASAHPTQSNEWALHGFFDLTGIPNSGYGAIYEVSGDSSTTAHAHYCDSYISDGTTDGVPTTHAFLPNQTQVYADGFIKTRGYDYYEESGYQSIKFGGTIPSSVHVIVTYPY